MPLASNKLLDRFLLDGAGGLEVLDSIAENATVATGKTVEAGQLIQFDIADGKVQPCDRVHTQPHPTDAWNSPAAGTSPKYFRLAEDKIVEASRSSTTLSVKVGTVSSGIITWGTAVTITTVQRSNDTLWDAVRLSDSLFVVGYNEDDLDGMIVACSVSGTAITKGTGVLFEGTDCDAIIVCDAGASKFIVFWEEPTATDTMMRVGTVSGETITLGSEATVTTTESAPEAAVRLADDEVLLFYGYRAGTVIDTARVVRITISSTTPAIDGTTSPTVWNNSNYGDGLYAAYLIATGKVLVVHRDRAAFAVTVSGSTITVGDAQVMTAHIYAWVYANRNIMAQVNTTEFRAVHRRMAADYQAIYGTEFTVDSDTLAITFGDTGRMTLWEETESFAGIVAPSATDDEAIIFTSEGYKPFDWVLAPEGLALKSGSAGASIPVYRFDRGRD
jgi:hypothetical protein